MGALALLPAGKNAIFHGASPTRIGHAYATRVFEKPKTRG
jgi:hypothetical protein